MARMSRGTSTFMEVPTKWGEKYADEFPEFAEMVEQASRWGRQADKFEVSLNTEPEIIEQIAQIAERENARGITRTIKAIASARAGEDIKVPNFHAGAGIIGSFIKNHAPDGWLYQRVSVEGVDDVYMPMVVTGVNMIPGDSPHAQDRITVSGVRINLNHKSERRGESRSQSAGFSLFKSEVANRTVPEILAAEGFYIGNDDMRRAYDEFVEHYRDVVADGFGEQYVSKRSALEGADRSYDNTVRDDGKYIVDLETPSVADFDSMGVENLKGDIVSVPIYPGLRVFDLATHKFWNTTSIGMERYKYNPGLRNSLVLPDSHKDLLDVLTTDLDVFKTDLVEGKSAGNVILAKGLPGMGKTLTAEIYSEIVERPLYAVHSGELGTDADKIRERLETVFQRAKRWNAVLLLDEADVFVRERGNNITHNAIVAEFLRTLEYFDGLMFMTTNRDDIIDEAIVSRCAAMITYSTPDEGDAVKIWSVLAETLGIELQEGMPAELRSHLPTASPRDIKMVLRLAARMAKHHDEALTVDHFRQASTFRGVKWES